MTRFHTPAERLRAIPLPREMAKLPRDARGYPIPFLVLIDKSGQPQFTINDHKKAILCRKEGRCAICGRRFTNHPVSFHREMWFVGGSRCFLHAHGAFIDPPMHYECAAYALRVCPFLAARRYTVRIDDAKLDPANMPDDMALVRREGMAPALPERFGLGLCYRYNYRPHEGIYTVPEWAYVEWWKDGEPVNAPATADPPPPPE